MPLHARIYGALILIVTALGAGCAAPTQMRGQVAPPDSAGRTDSTLPRLDPRHLAHIGQPYYPRESLAIPEEGICKMAVTIEPDGSISESHLVASSNFARLDAACANAFPADVRFIPATKAGKPIKVNVVVPIVWCLGIGCNARLH